MMHTSDVRNFVEPDSKKHTLPRLGVCRLPDGKRMHTMSEHYENLTLWQDVGFTAAVRIDGARNRVYLDVVGAGVTVTRRSFHTNGPRSVLI